MTIYVSLTFTFLSEQICRTEKCKQEANHFKSMMDLTADPCNDFNQFACGNYMNDANFPKDDQTSYIYDWMPETCKHIQFY